MNTENIEFIGEDGKQETCAYYNSESNEFGNWLANSYGKRWDFGLTVMPKKLLCKNLASVRNVKGNKAYRTLTRDELERALFKLVKLINKKVLKSKYTKFGEKLDMIMVVEGERNNRDLHAHFAIKKPETMSIKSFVKLVNYSLNISEEFEIYNKKFNINTDSLDKKYSYKLDIIDSGWLYYITKELDKQHVHNLYFV